RANVHLVMMRPNSHSVRGVPSIGESREQERSRADAQRAGCCNVRYLSEYVRAGLGQPDDEHALTSKRSAISVLRRVQAVSSKPIEPNPVSIRHLKWTAADRDGLERMSLRLSAARDGYSPGIADPLNTGYVRIELDARAKTILVGIVQQVAAILVAVIE